MSLSILSHCIPYFNTFKKSHWYVDYLLLLSFSWCGGHIHKQTKQKLIKFILLENVFTMDVIVILKDPSKIVHKWTLLHAILVVMDGAMNNGERENISMDSNGIFLIQKQIGVCSNIGVSLHSHTYTHACMHWQYEVINFRLVYPLDGLSCSSIR